MPLPSFFAIGNMLATPVLSFLLVFCVMQVNEIVMCSRLDESIVYGVAILCVFQTNKEDYEFCSIGLILLGLGFCVCNPLII